MEKSKKHPPRKLNIDFQPFTHSCQDILKIVMASLQMNSLCKIIFLLLSSITVSECSSPSSLSPSSLSKSSLSTSLRSQTIPHLRRLFPGSYKSNNVTSGYDVEKPKLKNVRPSEGATITKLLTRKSRSPRHSCKAVTKKLTRLGLHIYHKSESAHDKRIRRRSLLEGFQQRHEINRRWEHMHSHLKLLYCKLQSYPVLFSKDTKSIQIGIFNMLYTVQEEMVKMSLSYNEVTPETCPSEEENNSLLSEAQSFLNQVFSICRELQSICDRIVRSG